MSNSPVEEVINEQENSLMATLFVPDCPKQLIPRVGMVFITVADGETFYDNYATACGFQTRKSTKLSKDGIVTNRYVVCNRQGHNEKKVEHAMASTPQNNKKRKTTSARVKCTARVVFQFQSGMGYRIASFNEGHTHPMVHKDYRHLMKCNRNVEPAHQIFIQAGLKANVGPIRTFRLYKEISGSYEDIGATSVDFKNYGRDLSAFIDGADAQMIIDNFKFKQENCPSFKYFFEVDQAGKLTRIFWADETSVRNFQLFGDALSLDATYNTNRYKLIFTPFTGRDNHGGCVTFVAALIFHEDVESYTWILEKFVECMGSHPKLVITDQDPALRKVVPVVFPDSYHRFCLWHITKKIPDKISVALKSDPEFKSDFDGLIWSEAYEPAIFEQMWPALMSKYCLTEDKWFSEMFELRSYWIPAYFRDVPISGLFKTTSLSESENSFFKRYLNKGSDLVRIQMHYNSALDAQHFSYKVLTHADETQLPSLLTEFLMEQDASTVYTLKKFYEVQEEIVVAVNICVSSVRHLLSTLRSTLGKG